MTPNRRHSLKLRLFVFSLLAFLFWGIAPAGANNVPTDLIIVSCTGVGIEWQDFPERPVDLRVTVLFNDETTLATLSTEGARDGAGTIPLALEGTGTASVTVEWTLQRDHQSGPVSRELVCETTPSTSTVPTVPDVPSPPTGLLPPVSLVPSNAECGPDTLACTGPSASTVALIVVGWFVLGLGVALVWGARTKRAKT